MVVVKDVTVSVNNTLTREAVFIHGCKSPSLIQVTAKMITEDSFEISKKHPQFKLTLTNLTNCNIMAEQNE